MSKWFYVNFIIIIIVLWKISSSYWGIHIILGGLGFLFFMFNWMRHAMFATIRSDITRVQKIKYAKASKKAMPFHKWTGSIALLFIVAHAVTIINRYGFQPNNYKMMFGLMASIILAFVVLTGWLRLYRTTVTKRIFHLSLAFTLFYLIIIHILL